MRRGGCSPIWRSRSPTARTAISGIGVLGDRQDLFGPVASMPTTWRLLDRIDAAHLPRSGRRGRRPGRGRGRRVRPRTWPSELRLDFDATITIAH